MGNRGTQFCVVGFGSLVITLIIVSIINPIIERMFGLLFRPYLKTVVVGLTCINMFVIWKIISRYSGFRR